MKAYGVCQQDCSFLVCILNVTFFLSNHDPVGYLCLIPAAEKTEKRVVIVSLNMLIFFLLHTAFNPIICEHLSFTCLFSQCFVEVGNTIEGQLKYRVFGNFCGITQDTSGWTWSFWLQDLCSVNYLTSPTRNRGRGLNWKKNPNNPNPNQMCILSVAWQHWTSVIWVTNLQTRPCAQQTVHVTKSCSSCKQVFVQNCGTPQKLHCDVLVLCFHKNMRLDQCDTYPLYSEEMQLSIARLVPAIFV